MPQINHPCVHTIKEILQTFLNSLIIQVVKMTCQSEYVQQTLDEMHGNVNVINDTHKCDRIDGLCPGIHIKPIMTSNGRYHLNHRSTTCYSEVIWLHMCPIMQGKKVDAVIKRYHHHVFC